MKLEVVAHAPGLPLRMAAREYRFGHRAAAGRATILRPAEFARSERAC
jgi:hypothetical protein